MSMVSEKNQGWRQKLTGKRGLTALAVLAVAGGIGFVMMRPHDQPAGQRRFGGPVPVMTAVAQTGGMEVNLNALGNVTPLASVTVKTQIAGQLTQIGFAEGQYVKPGDFLAQIDPRPYQRQLEQYQGQLARDQALLKDAQLNLARYEKLLAEDSIARQQRDTQATLVKQYEGAVATDTAQVNSARLNLSYCRIVSPIAGRVGLRQVDAGNYVQTNDSNGIATITQMQPITALFAVPEDVLPTIMRRLREGAEMPVIAYDRSQTNKLAVGRVVTVDNQIDAATGTVKLRAQFSNQDESLFPNQFVNIRVQVDSLSDAVQIPTAAIQRGVPGTFVYLVREDNTVGVQPVTLGPSAADRIAVRSGLKAGDVVVIDGADKLRDGAQINLPGAGEREKSADAPRKKQGGQDRSGSPRAE